MTTMIVDSFCGGIGAMKARDQGDEMKVLAVLATEPMFSAFDATERGSIARSLDWLHNQRLIEYPEPQPGYPWCRVALTEAGRAALPPNAEVSGGL